MSESEAPKRLIVRPVFFTLVGLAAIAGVVAMPYLAGDPEEGALGQWGRFLGRFHPVLLHLPIGMLALVILLETGKLFRKDKGASTLVPVFFTVLTSIVAVICGFLLYQTGGYSGETVEDHLWWGIGFTVAITLAFVLKSWVDAFEGKGNFLYFLLLLGSAGVMTVASHDGGTITHGAGFLTAEAPNEVRELYNKLPVKEKLVMLDEEGDEKGPAVPALPPEEQVVYTAFIQPIFDQKCVSCHGPDKQKGKLRMDSYELTLEGGKEGEGFEPGSALDSNIIYRIHLPEDDDEHMPPEGKTQVEDHELAILEWWIDSGASATAKLGELPVTDVVKAAIARLVPAEVLEKQKQEEAEQAAAEAEAREEVAKSLESLQAEFPSAINFESQESSGLTFTAVSMRKKFGDEELAKLEPVVPDLVSVDLSATKVTDSGVKMLEQAMQLRTLKLSETEVTDAALETVAKLPELESLNLYGTTVTPAGVEKLSELPKLKRLYLWQTGVDEAAAEELREKMPDTEIVLGITVKN